MPHFRRRKSGTLAIRAVVVSVGASLLLAGCSDDDPSGSSQPRETTSAESSSGFPSLDPDLGLTRLSRIALEYSPFPPGSIRTPVPIAGQLLYHLAGKGESPRLEEYGTVIDGDMLYVRFDLRDIPKGERQALIDSVLATLEWR